jgi:hypothetical protein
MSPWLISHRYQRHDLHTTDFILRAPFVDDFLSFTHKIADSSALGLTYSAIDYHSRSKVGHVSEGFCRVKRLFLESDSTTQQKELNRTTCRHLGARRLAATMPGSF